MKRKAFRAAFPYTIPIFAGFWFLGLTYGIYMNVSGFSFWYPMIMSLTIFGGSLEFVAVSMLLAPYASFVLRDFHAGQVQRSGMEEGVFDLRYV